MAVVVMISTSTTSLPSSITSSLYLPPSTTTTHLRFLSTSHKTQFKKEEFLMRRRKTLIANISSQNPPLEVQKEDQTTSSSQSASDIVRNFYNGINKRDLASVEDLIADKCVYEDLIFPQPFVGRQAILEFFKKFTGSISKDLQFVIDDISDEDSLAIGVTWHLVMHETAWNLQLNLGGSSGCYRGVTWLLQRFPGIADKF